MKKHNGTLFDRNMYGLELLQFVIFESKLINDGLSVNLFVTNYETGRPQLMNWAYSSFLEILIVATAKFAVLKKTLAFSAFLLFASAEGADCRSLLYLQGLRGEIV